MSRLSNAALAHAFYERETTELRALASSNLEWAIEAEAAGNLADLEMYLDFACFHERCANDRAMSLSRLDRAPGIDF